MKRLTSAAELEALRHELHSARPETRRSIVVCGGPGCQAHGCDHVIAAFRESLDRCGLNDDIELRVTGCHGYCQRGILVLLEPDGVLYQRVKVEDVDEIVRVWGGENRHVERLYFCDPADGETVPLEKDVPFYARQQRILLGDNRRISPTSIEDAVAVGSYAALAQALFTMTPESVVDEIIESGLRGRGGGGFPTGRKWASCAAAESRDGVKYVICNADEGDPGAYMDRSLLEGNPHSVIEGMCIGAYAVGAASGFVYVRHEYPLVVEHLEIALTQAREAGLLGKNILGGGFDFDITVCRGGGAFVCGESTALIASLEGRVGEPSAKHVHTTTSGLWGRPTNINNVETWANVPRIIHRGADWFRGVGTEKSPGTKIFSLVGKINNTGLVEVPMGAPLRSIIFDIGGGIPDGKRFKAVQTGGPSGGCLPESMLDLPVDFDHLAEAGSMMGSGGMIVMDEDTCMVDVARYFVRFLTQESCGKCVPCREGLTRMLEVLDRICDGDGRLDDLDLLEDLCETLAEASLCGLGRTAPNPVRSTLRYFRDEYERHILDRACPAGVCRNLIHYHIDADACVGCGACASACPTGAVSGERKKPHVVDPAVCDRCGLCLDACRFDAVMVMEGEAACPS